MAINDWENQMLDLSFSDRLSMFDDVASLEIVEPYFDEFALKLNNGDKLMFSSVVHGKVDNRTIFNKDIYSYKKKHDELVVMMGNNFNTNEKLDIISRYEKFYGSYYGLNLLHIVFGLLCFPSKKGNSEVFPIFICPCSLKQKGNSTYFIEHKERIKLNPRLRLLLKKEYNIGLPSYNSLSLGIRDYIDNVLLPKLKFKIPVRYIEYKSYITLYFAQDMILIDKINVIRRKLKDRPLLKKALNITDRKMITNEDIDDFLNDKIDKSNIRLNEKMDINDMIISDEDILSLNLISPCDMAQIKVVEYAKKNLNFTVTTPFGCNKNTAITNIISDKIMDGKKVLYVNTNSDTIDSIYEQFCNLGIEDNVLNYADGIDNVSEKVLRVIDSRRINPSQFDYITEQDSLNHKLSNILELFTEYKDKIKQTNSRFGVSYSYAMEKYMKLAYLPDYDFSVEEEMLGADNLAKTKKDIGDYLELFKNFNRSNEEEFEFNRLKDVLEKNKLVLDVNILANDTSINDSDIPLIYEKYVAGLWCENIKESGVFEKYDNYDNLSDIFSYKDCFDKRIANTTNLFKDKIGRIVRKNFNSINAGSLRKKIVGDRNAVYSEDVINSFPVTLASFADMLKMSKDVKFDTVIVDNAHTQFSLNLLPALYYADQIVILGDDSMPQYTIKQNQGQHGKEVKEVSSLFSTAKGYMPNVFLDTHYQSQDDELAFFPNKEFYRGMLSVFPCPGNAKKGESGVIDAYAQCGVYNTDENTNLEEAKRCIEILKNEMGKHSLESLGIITFTPEQARLISRLLEEEVAASHKLNEVLGKNSYQYEKLYIQTADTLTEEQVRDTIIISFVIAKKEGDERLESFGFLNMKGMDSVLNRALTLARKRLFAVHSVSSEELPNGFRRPGARAFGNFVRYLANPSKMHSKDNEGDNDLNFPTTELEIEFNNKGYIVQSNYGIGKNMIPLVVFYQSKQPYLAVDFADVNLMKYPTCYESLYSREHILSKCGWRYLNIWLLYYFLNKDDAMKHIFDASHAIEQKYEVGMDDDEDEDEFDQANIYNFPTYRKATFKILDPVFFANRLTIILNMQAPIYITDIFEQCSLMLLSCHNLEDSLRILNYSLRKVVDNDSRYQIKNEAVYKVNTDIEFRVADIRSVKVRGFDNIVFEELVAGMKKIKGYLGKNTKFERVLSEMKRLMRTDEEPKPPLLKKMKKTYKSL